MALKDYKYRIYEKAQSGAGWYPAGYYTSLKKAKKNLTPYKRKFHRAIIQKKINGYWRKIYPK